MRRYLELENGGGVDVNAIIAVTCHLDRGIGSSHTHECWIVRVHLSSGSILDVAECRTQGATNATAKLGNQQAYGQAVHWASSIRKMMLDNEADQRLSGPFGELVNLCGEPIETDDEEDGWPDAHHNGGDE